jgi:hypothetical protein
MHSYVISPLLFRKHLCYVRASFSNGCTSTGEGIKNIMLLWIAWYEKLHDESKIMWDHEEKGR